MLMNMRLLYVYAKKAIGGHEIRFQIRPSFSSDGFHFCFDGLPVCLPLPACIGGNIIRKQFRSRNWGGW